jgi:putative oxidoreductase
MRRWLERLQPLGLLIMRLALGAVMTAHGYPKVFQGGFGHSTAVAVGNMGLPAFLGYVAAYLEFIGGMMLVLGLFTRVLGFLFAGEMLVVILKLHLKNGIGVPGGVDLALVCMAIAFALVVFGAGLISVDHLIFGQGLKSGG